MTIAADAAPFHRASAHPGEVLLEEVLKPLRLTHLAAAKALRMSGAELEALVRCRRPLTPVDAERLADWLGTSQEFWLALQARHTASLKERR